MPQASKSARMRGSRSGVFSNASAASRSASLISGTGGAFGSSAWLMVASCKASSLSSTRPSSALSTASGTRSSPAACCTNTARARAAYRSSVSTWKASSVATIRLTLSTPTARFFGRPRTRQRRRSSPSPKRKMTSCSLTSAAKSIRGAGGTAAAGSGSGSTTLAAKAGALSCTSSGSAGTTVTLGSRTPRAGAAPSPNHTALRISRPSDFDAGCTLSA